MNAFPGVVSCCTRGLVPGSFYLPFKKVTGMPWKILQLHFIKRYSILKAITGEQMNDRVAFQTKGRKSKQQLL